MSTSITDAVSRYVHLKNIWTTCSHTLRQFNIACRDQYNLVSELVYNMVYDDSIVATQAMLDKALWCIISLIMGIDIPLNYFNPHEISISCSRQIISDFMKYYNNTSGVFTSYAGYDEDNQYDYTQMISMTLFCLLKNKYWMYQDIFCPQYLHKNTDIEDVFNDSMLYSCNFCDEEFVDYIDGVIVQEPYLDEFFTCVSEIVNSFFSSSISERIVTYLSQHPEEFLPNYCIVGKDNSVNTELPDGHKIVFWYREGISTCVYNALCSLMNGTITGDEADEIRNEVFLQSYGTSGLSDRVVEFLMKYSKEMLCHPLTGFSENSASPTFLFSKALGFFLSSDKGTLEQYNIPNALKSAMFDFMDLLAITPLDTITMFFASSSHHFIQPCVVDGCYVSGTYVSSISCNDGCNVRNINLNTILLLEMADALYQIVEEYKQD